MDIITTIAEMQRQSRDWQRRGLRVGLVPTMGCLHAGHLSLVDICRGAADRTVVSIFVNPTQFGPGEDLDAYPRTFDADRMACAAAGVDAIFFPDPAEMVPADNSTWVVEESLSRPLCGRDRPTHFRGVATVVLKLFLAALPDVAVFGRKDAQQVAVIRRMVRDLNVPVTIRAAPIVREPDGLAMSSRNRYLDPEPRQAATSIYRGLTSASARFGAGLRDPAALERTVREAIEAAGGHVDYVDCRNADDLQPAANPIDRPALLAVAARFGPARLIDNTTLSP